MVLYVRNICFCLQTSSLWGASLAQSSTIFINAMQCKDPMKNNKDCRVGQLTRASLEISLFWSPPKILSTIKVDVELHPSLFGLSVLPISPYVPFITIVSWHSSIFLAQTIYSTVYHLYEGHSISIIRKNFYGARF